MLSETHELFEERTSHKVLERYGMTETNMSTSNPFARNVAQAVLGSPCPVLR